MIDLVINVFIALYSLYVHTVNGIYLIKISSRDTLEQLRSSAKDLYVSKQKTQFKTSSQSMC
uniref:Uncharacterized protein n=1 Tax=Anguilla anguilla TaxID=7936 RepID=A0A0E9WZ63_ANGAN